MTDRLDWWQGERESHFADSPSRRYCVSPEKDGGFRVWMDRGIPIGSAATLEEGKALAQAHSERW